MKILEPMLINYKNSHILQLAKNKINYNEIVNYPKFQVHCGYEIDNLYLKLKLFV